LLKDSLKFLARDRFIYGVSGSIAKFIAIFTVPILTRILTKEDYGTIDAAMSATAIFGSLVILGQDSAIARFFYDSKQDLENRKRVATVGLTIQLLLMGLLAVILLFFSDAIGRIFFSDNRAVIGYWKMAVLRIPGSALFLFSINLFKWTFQRGKYLILTLGSTFLNVGLTLYLVVGLRWGVLGAIIPGVASATVCGLVGSFWNRKYLDFRCFYRNGKLAKEMFVYGLPFTAVMLMGASCLPLTGGF